LFDVSALDALPLALAGTSFALGARHGLDWDHIAAITDLTAPRAGRRLRARHGRRGLSLSLCYCLGHGLVLAVLGGLVLLLGVGLPAGMDAPSSTSSA
jgi:high-affinity nickel-transport protein